MCSSVQELCRAFRGNFGEFEQDWGEIAATCVGGGGSGKTEVARGGSNVEEAGGGEGNREGLLYCADFQRWVSECVECDY